MYYTIPTIISINTLEGRIILAIEAIRTTKKMNITRASKLYNVPRTSLRNRIAGRAPIAKRRNVRYQLSESEENTIVQYVLDLDSRGFLSRIKGIEDIANLLREIYGEKRVGKN